MVGLSTRPRPILDAFKSVGSAVALAGSVVTSAVGWGIFTAQEGNALTGLIGAIPGAVALVTAVLAAFGVVKASEPLVTPVASPHDNSGNVLTPAGS